MSESQHPIIKWHSNGCLLLASAVFAFLFVFATAATLLPTDLKQTGRWPPALVRILHGWRYSLKHVYLHPILTATRLLSNREGLGSARYGTDLIWGIYWHMRTISRSFPDDGGVQMQPWWTWNNPPKLPSSLPCCHGSVRSRQVFQGFQLQSNDVLESSLMPQREEKRGGKDRWPRSFTENHSVSQRATVLSAPTIPQGHGEGRGGMKAVLRGGGGRGIADLPSDCMWPISHMPPLICRLWPAFFSLHSAFRCIVYVSRAGSIRRFDVPNSITVICRHEKVCRTRRGWNRLFPNDTFLRTGYASDAIWWMCWQQLWSWKLKEQHGSRVGS